MSSSVDKSLFKIDQLNERNYATWAIRIQIALSEAGCKKIILGQELRPTAATDDANREAIEDWDKRNEFALHRIQMSVSDKELIAIQDATLAHDAWERIKQSHKVEGAPGKLMLLNRLTDLRMEEGSSAQEYVNRFDSLVVDCAALGLGLDKTPELLALFFLRGLPKSLETFAQYLTLSHTEDNGNRLTPRHVTTSLINHIRTQSSRADNQSGEDAALRVDKASAKCHGCGKKGHFKSECRKTKREEGQQAGSSRRSQTRSRQDANKATTAKGTDWGLSASNDGDSESDDDEAAAFVASTDSWTLDSGASQHFTNNRRMLVNYEPYVTQVRTANHQVINTVGRGTLRVRSTVNGVTHTISFDKVLYIPNFANLISVGRLVARGANIAFTKQGCDIRMKSQTIMRATDVRRNVWRLQLDPIEEAHVALSVEKVKTLHRRLGHPSVKSMQQLVKDGILPDINKDDFEDLSKQVCVPCVQGKQHCSPFPTSTTKATVPLERVHSDLAGPMPVRSFSQNRYMMTIWDEATSFLWSYPIKSKSDAHSIFVAWQARVERETGNRVKTLRTDNGGEYTSNEFKTYLRTLGVKAETTIPHTPQQNGKAERGNRTIEEKITCLLQDSNGIDQSERGRYWAEALSTATYLINRTPTSTNSGKTPYEAYYGSKPPLHHLRTFGSKAYAHCKDHKKHMSKSIECIFLGYGDDRYGKKAYRLKTKSDGKIIFSRDVKFDESPANSARQVTIKVPLPSPLIETDVKSDLEEERGLGDSDKPHEDSEQRQESRSKLSSDSELPDDILDQPVSLPQAPPEPSPPPAPAAPHGLELSRPRERRPPVEWWKLSEQRKLEAPKKKKAAPKKKEDLPSVESANFVALAPPNKPSIDALDNTKKIPIPRTFHEAVTSDHAAYWKTAMDEEMASFEANGVFELTELPKLQKPVGGRWVYSIKLNEQGAVSKFKARWVAKGYSQREGIDFTETYAPVSKMASLRTLLTIAADEDLELRQIDFKTAFLTARLVETVYMDQPTGYEQSGLEGRKLVAHLLKAVYGLRQSPLAFYDRSGQFFETIELKAIEADSCLYVGWKDGRRRLLLQYVDDVVVAGAKQDIDDVIEKIRREFVIDDRGNMDTGMLLGMEVTRDRVRRTIRLSQSRYSRDILERFDMADVKPARTPMDEHRSLMIDNNTHTDAELRGADQSQYLQAVGSLMYLMISTRPDLAYPVGVISRYSSDPRAIHWAAVKRIIRYLAGTIDFGIILGGHQDAPTLEVWTDADYAGDTDTRRSTSGFLIKFRGSPILWASRRQKAISRSSLESEYIALSQGCQNVLWILKLLKQIGQPSSIVPIHIDNQGAIESTKNGTHSERTKHIDVAYKYGRELLQAKVISLVWCPTVNMTADLLTKALGWEKFERFRNATGVERKHYSASLGEREC